MIRTLFFDLDGILVDLCDLHYDALNDALCFVAEITISRNEHLTTFNGLSTRQKLERLCKEKRIEERQIAKINDVKQKKTIEQIQLQTKPDPVKITMCKGLIRDGFDLVCVSNCVEASVQAFLECANIREYFNFFVCNEFVRHPKPAPDPYFFALGVRKTDPNEVLAFEDQIRGVTSAKAAGVPVIQLTYPQVRLSTIRRFIVEYERKN